ncbi:MAG: DJ-1/PfpI family protein [Leptospira sp.]|nr:DJ-1/PfpI family protein [Leptospira sp.]
MAKKILVPLLPGFEEMEAIILIDVLRRGQLEVFSVSNSREPILASRNTLHIADLIFSEVEGKVFDAIVLPGGLTGTKNLMENESVKNLLIQFHRQKKMIGAICAAPNVLRKFDIIRDDIPFTAFPTSISLVESNKSNYLEERIVSYENIHTSIGPGSAFEFALYLLEKLTSEETMIEVKKGLYLPDSKL